MVAACGRRGDVTQGISETSASRPLLFGAVGEPIVVAGPRGGANRRLAQRGGTGRVAHIDARIDQAFKDFEAQVDLAASINAADPQLVLVLEAVEDRTDLLVVAQRIGLEVLIEAESAMDPDEDYVLRSKRPTDPVVHTSLHAVCADESALKRLRSAWTGWKKTGQVPGNAKLRDLFVNLRDLRPWGPQDRLKMVDWDDYFSGLIPESLHSIEVELWYRRTEAARARVQQEVTDLITSSGGAVLSTVTIAQIGYHGIRCEVPTQVLSDLAQGDFEHVQLVKSSNVMFLRATGQMVPAEYEVADGMTDPSGSPSAAGRPVVCLLDGVPVANHPLLDGRVVVFDPDDLDSGANVKERKHGTGMASAVVWGDLGETPRTPAVRPVLVRPILVPSPETTDRTEEVPRTELVPDLMWRVFRELFDERADGGPVAPDVVVVNLSVGDPTTPFDSIMSSWARMIDWLSYHYGVLVVVSAGNHRRLPLGPLDSASFTALHGEERQQALLDAQQSDLIHRRLLSPAESINALTVGALHSDSSGPVPAGYIEDPTDGLGGISPVTAIGRGYRRGTKPDLVAPGGRVVYQTPILVQEFIDFRPGSLVGPGIRVAHPGGAETHTVGTSPAAALVSRHAARLHDELDRIVGERQLTRRERAVAIKALLAHGATPLDGVGIDHPVSRLAIGNGALARDFTEGCASNEAVILYLGALRPKHAQDLLFPLPDGLGVQEVKRVGATLAWLSPINWRHRQYRQAALSFAKPGGGIPDLGTPHDLGADDAKRGATTLQHLVWETRSSFGVGQGSAMSLRVKCFDQAGYVDDAPIDYAVALSLWVAPTIGVDVYTQVRDQLRVQVRTRPMP